MHHKHGKPHNAEQLDECTEQDTKRREPCLAALQFAKRQDEQPHHEAIGLGVLQGRHAFHCTNDQRKPLLMFAQHGKPKDREHQNERVQEVPQRQADGVGQS